MTLFLEGMPSAGGPRSRRSRAGPFAGAFLAFFLELSVSALLVMSVKGKTSVESGAAVASAASSVGASSFPLS